MTQQPEDKGEKLQLKVSSLNKKDRTMGGGIRQYATLGGVVVIIILLVVLVFRGGQLPQPAASTPVVATSTPPEVATIQALETNAALLVTPSVDPNVAALQTQNAILIQNSTDQAGTSQANLSRPTETPRPTEVPPVKIITATSQPTEVPPVKIITATPQPTQQPVVVVTATTPPQAPQPTVAPTVGTQSSTGSISNYKLSGASYDSYTASGVIDRRYNAVWTSDGRLWQPSLPPASERKANNTAIKIMPGRYTFDGNACAFYLDTARNGQGSQNPLVASYGNGIEFKVITADGLEAWGLVECRAGADTGFQMQYIGQ